tara:strand:- start:1269 stop:1877 length:609 start_codon:yes stop_codon:yes gene_type:complete
LTDTTDQTAPLIAPDAAALAFLLTRRSRIAKTLTFPGPDRATVETMLKAAARSPDHGKMEPWRFVVLAGPEAARLGALTRELGPARGIDPDRIEKHAEPFELTPLTVAVIAAPKSTEKVPEVEQTLSAGAVCLALLNASLASGWGANWLTAWMAQDREFLETGLGLAPHEWVAGFIHIGTPTRPVSERPRPDMDAKVEWRGI